MSATSAILCYGDSTALQASGDAAVNVARGRIHFSRGKFSFAGSSALSLAGGNSQNGFYLGDSDTVNRKATLTVSDAANVDLSGAWFVQLGSKSNAYPSESVLNVNGGKLTLGYHNVIGAGVNRSELSIGGGATVRVPYVGLSIGSPYCVSSNFGANGSGCFATGVVSVANGTLANEGDGNNADWGSDRMAGLIVGNGTVPLSSGAWFSGRLNVGDGAFVTNGPCPVVVGIGLGEGKVVQTGGAVVSTGTYGLSQDGGPRGSWEAKPVVIGAFGGRGGGIRDDGRYVDIRGGGVRRRHRVQPVLSHVPDPVGGLQPSAGEGAPVRAGR